MLKIFLSFAVWLILCGCPTLVLAKETPLIRKVISLKQQTTRPTFTALPLRLVDRGRLVTLGSGLMSEQQTLHMLRLSDLKRLSVQAPLDAFIRSNPGMKASESDTRPVDQQFLICRLLFYDKKNQEAGIEVEDRLDNKNVRRHFFIHWNLRKGKLTEATLVARGRTGRTFSDSLPLGYDHTRREFYYVRQIYRSQERGGGRTVTIVGFTAGKPRIVTQFTSHRSLQSETYFDRVGRRALLLEYAELADSDPKPLGFLVHVDSGKVRSFEIPLTTYGAAFGPGGKRIYLYSSQLGELWSMDAASGSRVSPILTVGKQGHALGLVDEQRLLLLRNSGLRFFRLGGKELRRGPFVPMRRLYKGFSHVGGSLIHRGGVLIKNGDLLYITALPGE